jgi:hypothetical protein
MAVPLTISESLYKMTRTHVVAAAGARIRRRSQDVGGVMTDSHAVDRPLEYAWKALAAIRLVNGVLALFAPRWLAGRLGVRAESQAAMVYPLRMFGIRTVLIGADLFLEPEARERSLQQAVLIHACDATAALTAAAFGELPVRSALMAGSISSINTALAIFAARRMPRRGRRWH